MEELLRDNQRVRSCRAIYYGDIADLVDLCDLNCSHYALSLHNKDTDNDGTLKKEHIHCILRFGKQYTCKKIMALFGEKMARPFVFVEEELCRYYDYLTHKRDKDKYQYPQDQVVTDDLQYWVREYENHTRDPPNEKNIAEQIIDDIIATVPSRDLVRKYGREVVINYKAYRAFAGMVYYEESLRDKGVEPVSIAEEKEKNLEVNMTKGE